MTNDEEIQKLEEGQNLPESITDDDREFIQQMSERMPNLSIRHNVKKSDIKVDTDLVTSFLSKFKKK